MGADAEVLVLDDEPIVCERLEEHLASLGFNVETFTESQAAIDPPPAPTSRQRHPLATPIVSRYSMVAGSAVSSSRLSRRRPFSGSLSSLYRDPATPHPRTARPPPAKNCRTALIMTS